MFAAKAWLCSALCFVLSGAVAGQKAFCRIKNGTIAGTLIMKQKDLSVVIEGEIIGLAPGLHGFHVHSSGDLSDACNKAGSHFNPFGTNHGAPEAIERHVGDLGNIKADPSGTAVINIHDSVISLTDPTRNIIGRSIVVHEMADDLGLGGVPDSLTTGNSGKRIACCKICVKKTIF